MIRTVHGSIRDRKKAQRSRVRLNGEDVTSRCFYADDRVGVVGLYCVNAEGRKYVNAARTGAAKEWKHGAVCIRRAA